MPSPGRTPRRVLHERSDSQTNSFADIRMVPYTPPRAASEENDERDHVYSRTALPTSAAHVFPPTSSAYYWEKNEQGLALTLAEDDVSPELPAAKSQTTLASAAPIIQQQSAPPAQSRPLSAASTSKPRLKKRKHVAVDPQTKTFKVLDIAQQDTPRALYDNLHSSPLTSKASYGTLPLDASRLDQATGSRVSHIPESNIASSIPFTPTSKNAAPVHTTSSTTPTVNSPWNYTLVGGLRKVPKTPDLKKDASHSLESPPPVPEALDFTEQNHNLSTKPSFTSTKTISTISDNHNYQVYSSSSPPSQYPVIAPPSSSGSNVHVFLTSSPPRSLEDPDSTVLHHTPAYSSPPRSLEDPDSTIIHHTLADSSPPRSLEDIDSTVLHHTPASSSPPQSQDDPDTTVLHHTPANSSPLLSSSNQGSTALHHQISSSPAPSFDVDNNTNYVLYGTPSVANSTVTLPKIKETYSQESLLVAPLAPRARFSADTSRQSVDKSRVSTERPLGERLKQFKSDSSAEARNGSINSLSTVFSQREATQAVIRSGSIIDLPPPPRSSGWLGARLLAVNRSLMQESPHQWSSQLSTVPSESEGGSYRDSRSWSDARRSSGVVSALSRQLMQSAGSFHLNPNLGTSPSVDSLEVPHPAFHGNRGNVSDSSVWLVEDSEHEDVITDMPDMLRPRPSRTRLPSLRGSRSSQDGRTSTMRSSASSRLNSLTANSLPTWAKLYYGSGEHKNLGAPGSSIEDDSRPPSAWTYRSDSPDVSNFPLGISSPRRRPRDMRILEGRRGSMDISPAPIDYSNTPMYQQWTRRLRERTSSIWSPHLQTDRRAVRQSVWEPPETSWSAERSWMGRRNRQVVLFIVGFIFPLAWMIAAMLPLPLQPKIALREKNRSQQRPDDEDTESNLGPAEDKHFLNANWWRGLNRWMSLIGAIVITVIIVLAVIGKVHGWT